jgi:alkyldihydroxyacetonephosphate synthase
VARNSSFQPDWIEEAPKNGSYRSIFKWGDPVGFKHPNSKLYKVLKETFHMTDEDFKKRVNDGNEPVHYNKPVKLLTQAQAERLKQIVGKENVSSNDYDRLKYATGKTTEEAMKLRKGIVEEVSDIVVHPRNKEEVQEIVLFCNEARVPIYVYGGGSSVNFGLRPTKGGITLVMTTHMNKVIGLNETNQTITVQPGILGPAYEESLNQAPERFNAKRRYTGGHFPQSFEYSTVGGWIVTLGAGQQSSYYGDAYDLVISQEYITPTGTIKTLPYPATANGPKVNDIMKGSEGCFGILVEATLRIFRYMPQNRQYFSFIFPSWEDSIDAAREISQGEFGMPAVFRISDEEETHIGLKLYGIDGTILDKLMILKGYKPMKRCLFIASADGEKIFAKNIKKNAARICKQHGGMCLSGYPTKKWEPGRYRDPYLREDLQDYGILIETLDTAVTWDNIHNLHTGVRKVVKARPNTVCMTHASHFYSQGTNLYFIFIARLDDVDEFIDFENKILDAFQQYGGSPTHHHGVGKLFSPWMEKHLGKESMDVLKALKKHFDPNNIMNPGGQMGLDLNGKNWRDLE